MSEASSSAPEAPKSGDDKATFSPSIVQPTAAAAAPSNPFQFAITSPVVFPGTTSIPPIGAISTPFLFSFPAPSSPFPASNPGSASSPFTFSNSSHGVVSPSASVAPFSFSNSQPSMVATSPTKPSHRAHQSHRTKKPIRSKAHRHEEKDDEDEEVEKENSETSATASSSSSSSSSSASSTTTTTTTTTATASSSSPYVSSSSSSAPTSTSNSSSLSHAGANLLDYYDESENKPNVSIDHVSVRYNDLRRVEQKKQVSQRERDFEQTKQILELIGTIPMPPIPTTSRPLQYDTIQCIAAICLMFGPFVREQLFEHAKGDTASPFRFMLESDEQFLWWKYADAVEQKVSEFRHSKIAYRQNAVSSTYVYNGTFPNEITVCNVTVRARPPQNVGSLFADLPADIISVIATHTTVGSIRDLCALRRISTKWARGMRGFQGELRIVGVTREPNKMSAQQMKQICTHFPMARAITLDIGNFEALSQMRFKDLRALLFRCPYAPLRDDVLKHIPNVSTLELFEVDNISDQGVQIVSTWTTLRDVRLVDCTAITARSIQMLATLPKLESLAILTKSFDYTHVHLPECVADLAKNTSLKTLVLEGFYSLHPQDADTLLASPKALPSLRRFAFYCGKVYDMNNMAYNGYLSDTLLFRGVPEADRSSVTFHVITPDTQKVVRVPRTFTLGTIDSATHYPAHPRFRGLAHSSPVGMVHGLDYRNHKAICYNSYSSFFYADVYIWDERKLCWPDEPITMVSPHQNGAIISLLASKLGVPADRLRYSVLNSRTDAAIYVEILPSSGAMPAYGNAALNAFLERASAAKRKWRVLSAQHHFVTATCDPTEIDWFNPPETPVPLIPSPPLCCTVPTHSPLFRQVTDDKTCMRCSARATVARDTFWVCECNQYAICEWCYHRHRISPRFDPPKEQQATKQTPVAITSATVTNVPILSPGEETFKDFRARLLREIKSDPNRSKLTRSEIYAMIMSQWRSLHPDSVLPGEIDTSGTPSKT